MSLNRRVLAEQEQRDGGNQLPIQLLKDVQALQLHPGYGLHNTNVHVLFLFCHFFCLFWLEQCD